MKPKLRRLVRRHHGMTAAAGNDRQIASAHRGKRQLRQRLHHFFFLAYAQNSGLSESRLHDAVVIGHRGRMAARDFSLWFRKHCF